MLRSVQAKRGSLSAAAALSACLIALSLSAASAESAVASSCSGGAARAASASPGKLRSALMCLINRKRSANGLRALKVDRRLQKAASRHAHDMLRNRYFDHQRRGGPDLTERLRRAGWDGRAWGENIAYGCGSMGTPRATLRMWMHSPPHRAILLSGTYRNGGLGVTDRALCGSGSMWVLDVGRK
jgi:uncharacterized protein YkwD